ncbi:MAG: hypothetical protein GTO45_03090 [Candidatus Aminicenantes bacterium]|nr:hypothetical protein [Candidatus Aminicenantes bacterium]NIM77711.1 hypothetical protein [Candidatus Aminicenantes bacterium]NIN17024.1 hypothetical protein [Candidatus Aminicenantes bacterium]NIN40917.1 hypothetical protein [Candidatus Aminicenantes bacterium]NIN83722.1 hypothetical protein [Candidatus Aminicenantes bacterium]
MSVFSLALDPGKKNTQYMHEVWEIEQGLPQNAVYTIVQTREGYLWLGTEEGLVRFDGVHFEIYDKRKVKQLTNNKIYALCEDREGNLWIGTYGGGLTRLDTKNGKFTTFTEKQNLLSNNQVTKLCEDNEGNLWIGTESGLNRMKAGKITG